MSFLTLLAAQDCPRWNGSQKPVHLLTTSGCPQTRGSFLMKKLQYRRSLVWAIGGHVWGVDVGCRNKSVTHIIRKHEACTLVRMAEHHIRTRTNRRVWSRGTPGSGHSLDRVPLSRCPQPLVWASGWTWFCVDLSLPSFWLRKVAAHNRPNCTTCADTWDQSEHLGQCLVYRKFFFAGPPSEGATTRATDVPPKLLQSPRP